MDDFEQDVRRALQQRVSGMPEAYDVSPAVLERARRRRARKLSALAVAVAVAAAGTVAAIVSVGGHDRFTRVSTTVPTATPTRPSVATVACPVDAALRGVTLPTPKTEPRVPAAGDAGSLSHLWSYAATDDPRYVVLGPRGWTCHTTLGVDGQNSVVVRSAGSANFPDPSGIAIVNDFLWHGGVGSELACQVSDDPAVVAYVQQNFPGQGPCPRPGRTLTRVDAHTTTFVDRDGTRGAGWVVRPSSSSVDDGRLGVLTCRPTAGLTVADCDTIVADWVARVDAVSSEPATTEPVTTVPGSTSTPAPETTVPVALQVPAVTCPVTYGVTTSQPLPAPSPQPRALMAGDPALVPTLASFAASTAAKFVVLGPRGWTCRMTVGADGNAVEQVYPGGMSPGPPFGANTAPITIDDDWLWHGGVGSVTACSVFDDPAVVRYMTENWPRELPCPRAGRTVARLDAHAATFVDADGTRGGAWMLLPTAQGGDGFIDVLTCRPTTGLTTAQCDTIVADFVARVDAAA